MIYYIMLPNKNHTFTGDYRTQYHQPLFQLFLHPNTFLLPAQIQELPKHTPTMAYGYLGQLYQHRIVRCGPCKVCILLERQHLRSDVDEVRLF